MGEQLDGFFKEVRVQLASLCNSLPAPSQTYSLGFIMLQGGYNPDMETFV